MDGRDRCRDRLDPAVEGGARHGIAAPRGLSAPPSATGGRFARMFPSLPPCDPGRDAIESLIERLEHAGDSAPNTRIPAGYTYLAQFVDHDITFDPTSKLDRDNDPHALVNFRTPRLDLDSVYGSGPAAQPFLYDWTRGRHPGVKLLVGTNPAGCGLAPLDLPRNSQGRAIIADARNDENLIVSQLHLLFIRFHNAVVDRVCARHPAWESPALFDEARRIVRWHYQWIVVDDLLRKIVGDTMAAAVLTPAAEQGGVTTPAAALRFFGWKDEPVMPVEFSAAAFRFGHSMVRKSYSLREGMVAVPIVPAPGAESEPHLGGFRALPDALRIDWRRFFGADAVVDSMKIDHRLAPPLFALPPDGASLPRLNLLRGLALGLPSGADVAHAMGREALPEERLLPPELWPPDHRPELRRAILDAPPLWLYVLREPDDEPEVTMTRLGPVGGRIVAEVLVGLLAGDDQSYVRRWPTWTPELPAAGPGTFTMPDLVDFTLGRSDAAGAQGSHV